jgi:uncharacterized protein (TIGR03067 family)
MHGGTVSRKLPKRPNLDHLRTQAKQLLTALHEGDKEAALAFIEHLPAARKLTPARARAAGFRLADAQSAIARKTGFAGWPALARHVRTLRAFEGEWRFDGLETDGVRMPRAAFGQSRILIDGDCFKTESPEATYQGVFNIDVEAEPARIDIEFVEGPEAGATSHGIYRLRGDRLTFCLGLVGSSRPRDFATSKGSGHALEQLRRATGARPANVTGGTRTIRPSGDPGPDLPGDTASFESAPTALMKRLAGEWRPVEFVRDGQPMPDAWLAYGRRTIAGNETEVVFGGQTMLHANLRIDETVVPMTVDCLNLAGPAKGRISLGLLDWVGEEVIFHTASPGKPRPEGFVSAKGSGSTLSRWRRATGRPA